MEDEVCILLRYERLPQFCFQCGCLGHIFRDCGSPNEELKEFPFGPWLRAPTGGEDGKFKKDQRNGPIGSGSINVSGSNNSPSRNASKGSDKVLLKEIYNSFESTFSREESNPDGNRIILSKQLISNDSDLSKTPLIDELET